MDLKPITDFITTVGFPIALSVFLLWIIVTKLDRMEERLTEILNIIRRDTAEIRNHISQRE